MAGLSDDRSVDYVGPPPDPPPTGPELAGPPDYGPPPRPAGWSEKQDDGDTISSQEKDDGDGATTIQEKDGTSQERGETDLERGATGLERGATGLERGDTGLERGETGLERGDTGLERGATGLERGDTGLERGATGRPDSGARSETPSGAVPLLREDTSGVFRRMATREDSEDRQARITNARTPPGSGESVLALGQALRSWKRLLGLTVPGGWGEEEYHMLSDPPEPQHQQPLLRKMLTASWVLVGVMMVITSIGLQWAYCAREYYGRLQIWPEATSNTTSREYLCVPSFLWALLVPRLLFAFGYLTVFVCIFCLKLPDFEFVIARAYDVITEQRQSSFITSYFIDYCRRDPRVLAFWFVVIHALSLVSSLFGEDIVRWDLTEAKPLPSSALEWATYVITCLVRLMIDGMIGYCMVSYSLSIKYLELMVERSTWYLQTLITLRNSIHTCRCQYFFTRIGTVIHCVRGSQPCTSAALMLAMLRICQVASLVWVDQTSEPRRHSSLAQLPIAILFFLMVLHHIRRSISLTETWMEVFEKDAVFLMTPEPARPDPLNIIYPSSAAEENNRATVLWFTIIRQCPQVSGRVLGLRAGHWMYWAVLVVGTLYCAGYYALLKHATLI